MNLSGKNNLLKKLQQADESVGGKPVSWRSHWNVYNSVKLGRGSHHANFERYC